MKRLLIVGRSSYRFINFLGAHNYDFIELKDLSGAEYPDKGVTHYVSSDFSSQASILRAVDQITERIDGVIADYENYVLPAAWVAKHLDLPGMPIAAAGACTDKVLMRQHFANASRKISPDFALVRNEDDVRSFAARHQFPLILKPANLSKSLLVTKSHSPDELLENYRKTAEQIDSIYKKYAPNRLPRLLVEEFLEGSAHSVDAFVNADGKPQVLEQIVDYQTGFDIGFEDNFHYSRILPSALPKKDQLALRHCAALGIKALGMRSSPAHVEVIMTPVGPQIVEIGGRNGGYRERLYGLANGIDIIGNAFMVACGKRIDIQSERDEPVAVLELFPKTPGQFLGITCETDLRQLSSLIYLNIKANPNTFVGKSSDGHKMCALVVLHNSNAEQFNRDLAFVNKHVRVQTNEIL